MAKEHDLPLIVRFMEKVEVTDDCWNWTAHKHKAGYGDIHMNGKTGKAHRVSYELFIGKIPEGLQIDHLCRNRDCVNPEHLEPVTNKENSRRGLGGFKTGLKQRAKTHCPQKHEYTPDNLLKQKGGRSCKTCYNARCRAKRALKANI